MVIEAPPKPRDNMDVVIERFNAWANQRIADYEEFYLERSFEEVTKAEAKFAVEVLQFAKTNLERLAKEIERR